MATYKESGVDIEKAENSLKNIKNEIEATHGESVLKGIGSFGAMYDISESGVPNPVLVSSTDGVGTKLMVAVMADKHDTVGEDLVNHCVNDIAVTGAVPLFFLDYFATGKLNPHAYEGVIRGLVRGCKRHNIALIGGETAEMPDMYAEEDYDLAGTIVGVVNKKKIITGEQIREGDVLIGLESTGLHTNGYSLARRVLFNHYKVDQYLPEIQNTLGEELLQVHKSYLSEILAVREKVEVHGISHVTGGGIIKNTRRLLNERLELEIDWDAWEWLPIFKLIQQSGNVAEEEMRLAFNLGIGLIMIVAEEDESAVHEILEKKGTKSKTIGFVKGR